MELSKEQKRSVGIATALILVIIVIGVSAASYFESNQGNESLDSLENSSNFFEDLAEENKNETPAVFVNDTEELIEQTINTTYFNNSVEE